jgi:hypothetical protein
MEKKYGFLFLVCCLALVACDDDDAEPTTNLVTDTVSPVVEINAPEANDSMPVIDVITIIAEVKDDKFLDNVKVVLTEPGGGSQVISNRSLADRNYSVLEFHRLPKYAATGAYTVTVEAKDKGQNIGKNAVTFNLHASGIRSAAFVQAFGNALLNSKFSESLDGLGYNFWDYGYSFDEVWLSTVLYLMVTTDNEHSISEAEWKKFVTDFGLKNQAWATWDENKDGNLNEAEFHKGIISLDFFNDWDKNQDKSVYIEEMGAGLFILWDQNKDNLLSPEEYLEKFYTYLYR